MQVKNNSARLYTVNGVRIAPGATETVDDPDGVWEASIEDSTELEVVVKRGRPAKVVESTEQEQKAE